MVFRPHPRHAFADIHVKRASRDRDGLLQHFFRFFDTTELAERGGEPTVSVRRSRLFGQLPGRNKLKAGSRLLVSPFPEIKFILSCCGVL
jgi:hypothetical protein